METSRLVRVRKSRGLSQEKLADLAGVSRKTYSHWELGEREIKAVDLKKISDILGVSMAYLMGDGDENDAGSSEKSLKSDHIDVEMEIIGDSTKIKISIPPSFAENDITKIFNQIVKLKS